MEPSDSILVGWWHKLLCALGLRRRSAPDYAIAPEATPAPDQENTLTASRPVAPAHHTFALRDDFLSPAEISFFHILRLVVAEQALIFPKVRLGDLVYPPRQEGQHAAWQRINRKHVDFVLCDPRGLRPVAAIELDDRSHRRPERVERDAFVDRVFADARLPIVHVPARRAYHTADLAALIAPYLPGTPRPAPEPASPRTLDVPLAPPPPPVASPIAPVCARCGGEMRLRTATQGQRRGEQFWGCQNYPHCRHTAPYAPGVALVAN